MAKVHHHNLQIQGMTCEGCANTVKGYLVKQGAEQLKVDITSGQAAFQTEQDLDLEQIGQGLKGLGYQLIQGQDDQPVKDTLLRDFWITLACALPLLAHMFLPVDRWLSTSALVNVQLILTLPAIIIGIKRMGRHSWNALRLGTTHMDMLLLLGALAAFGYSIGGAYFTDHPHDFLFFETAATIVAFGLLGKVIESRAVSKTGQAISALEQAQPQTALKVVVSGGQEELQEVPIDKLMAGDLCQVPMGGVIPADGKLDSDLAELDQRMLTGESAPRAAQKGEEVYSGSILISHQIRLRLTRPAGQSTLAQLVDTMRKAQMDKPKIHRISDQFSRVFVPAILALSLGVFMVEWLVFDFTLAQALMNAVAVLVISCPCAMGLATPTAVTVAIGACARQGIVLRSAQVFEAVGTLEHIVFDKTGTLTTGAFVFDQTFSNTGQDAHRLIGTALALTRSTSHPVASAFQNHYKGQGTWINLIEVQEDKGRGMLGKDDQGQTWFLGRTDDPDQDLILTCNDQLMASWRLKDDMKPDAKAAIQDLAASDKQLHIASGDKSAKVEATARQLGLSKWHAERRPEQKLELINTLSQQGPVMVVGDGINDGPILAQATVGVTFAKASQVAIHSADVILLQEAGLQALPKLLSHSKKTINVIWQNLGWAVSYNLIAIPLAALGYLDPMVAAFAMAFSDVVVIGNSLRLRGMLRD